MMSTNQDAITVMLKILIIVSPYNEENTDTNSHLGKGEIAMIQNNLPDGDRIYDLYTGVYKPHLIRIALTLDVFSPLNAGPAKAEVIAQACRCDLVGIRHLLEYLTSLNVLTKQGDRYSLSPEAATFLVQGKKTYAGNLIMDFTGLTPWESLRETIRTGQPRNIDLEIHFAQDAWIESFRKVRITSSLEMWAKVGIISGNVVHLRILDIACGCAIKSLVLAQKSPNVELTCLDTPLVLEAARDLAERLGVSSQVRFVPENFSTVELGIAKYDVCLLGQITHYLTEQQNRDLYHHIQKALIPGGMLVLDVPMETTQVDDVSSFLSLLLWGNSGGRAYKFEEYRQWLLDNGFVTVHQLSDRLLSAVR
jgi:predicted O-methyltransferase YrrM